MYLSQFIALQDTIFKDICFKQGTKFCSIDLIYYEPANWSFRRQIPCANYFIIIIHCEFFLHFFPNQFLQKIVFFCVLAYENQDAFSESCSLISDFPQGLVKICKK